mgnify:CR=1 FL=1
MRVNLATNYTFLNGDLSGWSAENGATIAYTTDYAFYGAGALQVTKSSANASGVVMNTPIAVQAGKSYAISMYARLPLTIPASDTAELSLTVTWANSAGTVVGTNTSGNLDLVDDSQWYRLSGVWTAPAGATVMSSVRIYQPIAGRLQQKFILDALLIEQASFVGGFFFTHSEAEKYRLAQKALSRVPQVINGLRLGADISLNNLTFNTIDEFGTIWVVENIGGWDGQTAPEMPDIGRGTDDGSYDVEGRLTSRSITLSGFFIPADPDQALTDTKDRLVEAINLVRKGGWLRAHSEPTRAAWVRLSGAPQITTTNDRGRTQFSITLRAPDPIKYHWNDGDPDGYTGVTIRSSDIPDGTDTNLVLNPSFESTSNTEVEVRRNLCVNPQPTTGQIGGWVSTPTTSLSTEGFTTIPTANTTAYIFSANSAVDIVAGRTYVMRAKVTGTTLSGSPVATTLSVRPHKSTGNVYYTPNGGLVSVPADGVTRDVSLIWTATENVTVADGFNVSVVGSASTAANTFRLSMNDVLIEDAGTLVPTTVRPFFFGGGTSYDGDMTPAWVGTAYASASKLSGVNDTTVTSSNSSAIRSSSWANRGSYSLRIVPNGTSDVVSSIIGVTLQPGKTYTAVAKVRLNAVTGTGTYARSMALVQTGFATQVSAAAPNVPGAYDVRFTFTTNPAMTSYSFRLGGGGNGETEVWWDDLMIVEGTYTGDFFDGNSTNTPGYTHRWTGTPNASPSERLRFDVDIVNNIGNANVSGLFTVTGPAGPGSRIYNSLTDETITLAEPLRGKATVGKVIKMAAYNNVATITTERYTGLRVGDKVTLLGLPVPFTTPGQVFEVTAASDVFPFSFSFAVSTDDIDEVTVTGQVALNENDILVVDTYEKSVVYNGEVTGHRYRLVTLTDWVRFGPGINPVEFFDDALQINVVNKKVTEFEATVETQDIHYLSPGDQVLVALPETANLAKKSLNANVVTITTAEPHGFAQGDTVDVVSVETSVINYKARTGSAVTLTTVEENGVSVNDYITVVLPVTAVPSAKQLTTNVATITTQQAHGCSICDSVTWALPVTATVSAKQLFSNVATLTTVGSHGYAPGDSITVAMPAGANVIKKERIGSLAYITTATSHGYSVGDTVIVNLPASANVTTIAADGVSNLVTVTTSAAHNFSLGDKVNMSVLVFAINNVTSRSATTTTATLTIGSHNWAVGDRVTVTGIDSRFNGSFYITAVAATTISYASAGATVGATATTGATASNRTLIDTYNGTKVVETIPTSTTFTFRDWDQNVNSAARSLSGTVANDTNAAFNGTKTLQSAAGATFTYNL